MSASLLQRLIEAGTPVELIAEVAELMGDVRSLEKRRAADAKRKQEQRDRDAGHVTSRDVTDVTETPPSLDKESFPQTPFKEIKPTPRARAAGAQGFILPDGWKPEKLSRDTVSGQIVEKRGQDWAKRALETFENHWRSKSGKDARKRDWQGTWANWIIEQDRRDGRQPRKANDGNDGLGRTARAALAAFPDASLGRS